MNCSSSSSSQEQQHVSLPGPHGPCACRCSGMPCDRNTSGAHHGGAARTTVRTNSRRYSESCPYPRAGTPKKSLNPKDPKYEP